MSIVGSSDRPQALHMAGNEQMSEWHLGHVYASVTSRWWHAHNETVEVDFFSGNPTANTSLSAGSSVSPRDFIELKDMRESRSS